MVSTLDFRSGGRWMKAGFPFFLMIMSCFFLRQETLLHIASLHPDVSMDTFNAWGNVAME